MWPKYKLQGPHRRTKTKQEGYDCLNKKCFEFTAELWQHVWGWSWWQTLHCSCVWDRLWSL